MSYEDKRSKCRRMVNEMIRSEKEAIAKENGWQTHWHHNNWVRTELIHDSKVNSDWSGCSLDHAVEEILYNKDLR